MTAVVEEVHSVPAATTNQVRVASTVRLHRDDELLTLTDGLNDQMNQEIFWRECLDSDLLELPQPPALLASVHIRMPNRHRKRGQLIKIPTGTEIKEKNFSKLPRRLRRDIIKNPSAYIAATHEAETEELPIIMGTLPIHQSARDLVRKFTKVFKRKVQLIPARIEPMVLNFENEQAWKSRANSRAARPLTSMKAETLNLKIQKYRHAMVRGK